MLIIEWLMYLFSKQNFSRFFLLYFSIFLSYCVRVNHASHFVIEPHLHDRISASSSSAANYKGLIETSLMCIQNNTKCDAVYYNSMLGKSFSTSQVNLKSTEWAPGWIYLGKRDKRCEKGWIQFRGYCFFFDLKIQESWIDAQTACQNMGGYLVEPPDIDFESFLNLQREHNKVASKIWLGGTDESAEGTWEWVTTNKVFQYSNWQRDYPRTSGEHYDCLGSELGWNDLRCDSKESLVCQKASDVTGGNCQTGWIKFEGMCFLFVLNTSLTWFEAKNFCQGQNSHLAEVINAKIHLFIMQELLIQATSKSFWLGGTDLAEEGTWIWDHSKYKIDFNRWMDDNPSNHDGLEHCMVMLCGWDDNKCYQKYQFICQKEL